MDGLTSTFPPPPFYYKSFTEENVAQVENMSPEDQKTVESPLSYIIPPDAPDVPTYRGFGSIWNTQEKLIPLEEAGVPQLYGDLGENNQELVTELKKLLRSALVNFVALAGTMAVDPQAFPTKVEDLRTIFINMHHVLNLYRPHQSRESLIFLMKDQIAEIRANNEETRASNEIISSRINDLAQRFPKLSAHKLSAKTSTTDWLGLDLSIDRPQNEAIDEEYDDDMVIG